MASQWYYLQDQQKFGPVSSKELNALAKSGKLQATNLVWKDGLKKWVLAKKVKGLFNDERTSAATSSTPSRPVDLPGTNTTDLSTQENGIDKFESNPPDQHQWHYSRDGESKGPVSFSKLVELAQQAVVTRDSLVWHEGLDDWIPASEIEGLLVAFREPTKRGPPPLQKDPPRLPSQQSSTQLQREQTHLRSVDDTILIHRIFSPNDPWEFSKSNIEAQLIHAQDGNPFYLFTIDGIDIICFEITSWNDSSSSKHSPRRLVVGTTFDGVEITDPTILLQANYATAGFPSFGMDEDGVPTLRISIPISQDIPLPIIRGQLLVAIGLLAEEAGTWLENSNSDNSEEENDMASAVGSLLGGIARGFLE